MITNRVGPPVRGSDFFGREDFVRFVSGKLKAGANILLAAPRRFGKTSVMYNLMEHPTWDYKVVHADLEHLVEPADLISTLVVELARSDDRLSKIASGLSYFPKKIWRGFKGTFSEVELLKLKVKLREELRPEWQQGGEELFRRVSQSPSTIVFFLDEFPMMIDRMARSASHREEAKTMLRWLRALRLSPASTNARFLIAGSVGISHILNELGEISAINDFEQVRLDPFSPKAAGELLERLAASHGVHLPEPAKRKILRLIGTPVPYFIQVMFSEIEKAVAQDEARITPGVIERIYHEKVLGVDCVTYFDHYYGRLREYYRPREERAAKLILRELAVKGSLGHDYCYQLYKSEAGGQQTRESFSGLMSNLENDFYIKFEHKSLSYDFACKLLRDWWLRHYGMATADTE